MQVTLSFLFGFEGVSLQKSDGMIIKEVNIVISKITRATVTTFLAEVFIALAIFLVE